MNFNLSLQHNNHFMKRILYSLAILFALSGKLSFAQTYKPITLEDIWINYAFNPDPADEIVSMNDGEHYLTLSDEYTINNFLYKNGKQALPLTTKEMLIPKGQTEPVMIESFELSADETKLLIKTESERIYRHSEISKFYVLDLASKQLTSVSDKAKQRLADISTDGSKVAYIIDNNLYVKDLKQAMRHRSPKMACEIV